MPGTIAPGERSRGAPQVRRSPIEAKVPKSLHVGAGYRTCAHNQRRRQDIGGQSLMCGLLPKHRCYLARFGLCLAAAAVQVHQPPPDVHNEQADLELCNAVRSTSRSPHLVLAEATGAR